MAKKEGQWDWFTKAPLGIKILTVVVLLSMVSSIDSYIKGERVIVDYFGTGNPANFLLLYTAVELVFSLVFIWAVWRRSMRGIIVTIAYNLILTGLLFASITTDMAVKVFAGIMVGLISLYLYSKRSYFVNK